MKSIILFLTVILLFLPSCLTNFDVGVKHGTDRLPVFEGYISNWAEPVYFRLTWSDPENNGAYVYPEPIKNATIVLSDNEGRRDTLIYLHYIDSLENNLYGDSIQGFPVSNNEYFLRQNGGYYKSTLQGIPGRIYTVKIMLDDKEYTASDFMPLTTVLDSVKLVWKPIEGKEDGMYMATPTIYFLEPQETSNYYLITNGISFSGDQLITSLFEWRFKPLSDEFLQERIDGLLISNMTTTGNPERPNDLDDRFRNGVNMLSLSKDAYLYFDCMEDLMFGDGGAFTPAPSMAPTNFSHGMLGFFHASSVSRCHVKIE